MTLFELIDKCENELIDSLTDKQKEVIEHLGWFQFYSSVHSFICNYLANPQCYKLDIDDDNTVYKVEKCSPEEGFKMFMQNNYGILISNSQAKKLINNIKED